MAKLRGVLSAIYWQTTAASTSDTGVALTQVGSSLWYAVSSSAYYYWDKAKEITIYDGVTEVTPAEIDYGIGAVRLSEAPSGSVTADFYHFACAQVGGFRSFSLSESMELIECSCFEDTNEMYEPGMYSANGTADGFWSSTDSYLNMNGLVLMSKIVGPDGDDISAECIVSGNNTPLSIDVTSQKVTIHSATSGAGAATSKNWQIRDAIEADAEASALVKCKWNTDYATDSQTVMGAITEDNLAGGTVPTMLERFGEELVAVFFWQTGASPLRTTGVITFENCDVKAGVKGLVGRSVRWKCIGMLYDYQY